MKGVECLKVKKKKKKSKKNSEKRGYGLIDYIVNRLPEIHIPGYQYCGPGTDLNKRLARGDPGINQLDQACKAHDIEYAKVRDSKGRRGADKVLVSKALRRIYSPDAKVGERAAALLVSGLMGAKIGLSKIGLGLKKRGGGGRKKVKKMAKRRSNRKKRTKSKKTIPFGKLVRHATASIKRSKLNHLTTASSLNSGIKAAIRSVKNMKRNKHVKISRVLKLPKFGGSFIPIVPILTALSAIGSISSTAAGVVKAIKSIRDFNASGDNERKIGRGLFLTKSGSGFYLKPFHHR